MAQCTHPLTMKKCLSAFFHKVVSCTNYLIVERVIVKTEYLKFASLIVG